MRLLLTGFLTEYVTGHELWIVLPGLALFHLLNAEATCPHMSIKALTFDVFATVVDWRNSIIEQFQTFGREKGIALDWNAFVDDWKSCYRPGMNAANEQRLSCTNVDGIYRVKLDALLGEYGITGLTETEKIRLNRTWHRCKPWPDVVAGLTRLKTKYVLSTLSNGDVACLVNMAKYGALPGPASCAPSSSAATSPIQEFTALPSSSWVARLKR